MCYLVLRNLDYSVHTRQVSVCENAKMKMCNGNNGSSPMMSSNQISETVNVKNNKQVVTISDCRMCIKIVHNIFRRRSSAAILSESHEISCDRIHHIYILSAVSGSQLGETCFGRNTIKHLHTRAV